AADRRGAAALPGGAAAGGAVRRAGAGGRGAARRGHRGRAGAQRQDRPVPPDRSILEALLDEGVDVPNDCRDGICGSCETEVLDGEAEHRDYVLTEKERREGGTMMVCVSRARGQRLVLDR